MEATHAIPEKIQRELTKAYSDIKGEVKYFGVWKGWEIFGYHFKESVDLGYPIFYGHKGGEIREFIGKDAHDILFALAE